VDCGLAKTVKCMKRDVKQRLILGIGNVKATKFAARAGTCKKCGKYFDYHACFEVSKRHPSYGNALSLAGICRKCSSK